MTLDFSRRYRLMRMHSALHLLSVALPYPVTAVQSGSRMGVWISIFPEAGLEKDIITAELNRLIGQDAEITARWISDAELDANPQLVKTMSVKPPRGTGQVRLVEIAGLDLQPCGGTHVRNTREIGAMIVTNIEKKGKQNRRVRIAFAEQKEMRHEPDFQGYPVCHHGMGGGQLGKPGIRLVDGSWHLPPTGGTALPNSWRRIFPAPSISILM